MSMGCCIPFWRPLRAVGSRSAKPSTSHAPRVPGSARCAALHVLPAATRMAGYPPERPPLGGRPSGGPPALRIKLEPVGAERPRTVGEMSEAKMTDGFHLVVE